MFGYVMPGPEGLSQQEKDRYQAFYCGLCRGLSDRYGAAGRATLTYDMAFLTILLSGVYEPEETSGLLRCPVHPVKKHEYILTDMTAYAADMNLLLTYYKCLDDWADDRSAAAYAQAKLLKKHADKIRSVWPVQCGAISDGLKKLRAMEKANELNPDLPANTFGVLMGELFVRQEDRHSALLRKMGAALGRFIYLMDAVLDLPQDIKKQRYNPLVAQTDTDFTPVLTMLIGECTSHFEALELKRDRNILRNILYSGVWVKYAAKNSNQKGAD